MYAETKIVSRITRSIRMPATKDEIALSFMALAVRFGFRRTAVEDVARR